MNNLEISQKYGKIYEENPTQANVTNYCLYSIGWILYGSEFESEVNN